MDAGRLDVCRRLASQILQPLQTPVNHLTSDGPPSKPRGTSPSSAMVRDSVIGLVIIGLGIG